MLTKAEYLKILIWLFVVSFIIAIQVLIADDLFEMSIPIIKSLQEESYLVKAMQYITKLGSKKFKTLLLCIIFSLCNHYHAFIYALIAYTSMLVCGVLKINLQQPRPFWLSDEVQALNCEFGYGYPSNHVITTVPAFLIFYEIMFYRFEVDKKTNGRLYWWIGFLTVLLITIIVGFSRMVLGVHSLDQVVFGLVMGFALYYFFLDVIDLDLRNPMPFFRILFNKYYFYKLAFLVCLAFFGFIINIILISGSENHEAIWTTRIIRSCGKEASVTPFFKCLVDIFDFFAFVGLISGMLFDIKFINPVQKIEDFMNDYISYDKHSRVGQWNHTGFVTFVIRVILTYVQGMIIFMICGFVTGLFFTNGLITQMLLGKVLPMTLMGFCIFALYRKEFEYLHLTNRINHSYLNGR
jgi:membrane-associated phospholipid phosphatase